MYAVKVKEIRAGKMIGWKEVGRFENAELAEMALAVYKHENGGSHDDYMIKRI